MLFWTTTPLQVCNHKFHSECLKGWGDTSCPVCRYCHETSAAQSHCQACFPAACCLRSVLHTVGCILSLSALGSYDSQ